MIGAGVEPSLAAAGRVCACMCDSLSTRPPPYWYRIGTPPPCIGPWRSYPTPQAPCTAVCYNTYCLADGASPCEFAVTQVIRDSAESLYNVYTCVLIIISRRECHYARAFRKRKGASGLHITRCFVCFVPIVLTHSSRHEFFICRTIVAKSEIV